MGKFYFTSGLLALLAIFVLDIMIPLGVAIGGFHVIVLLLNRRATTNRITFIATLSILLICLKYIIYYEEFDWIILLNRFVQLLLVVLVAYFLVIKNKAEERIRKEKEEIIYMISHKIRVPVANCKGLADLLIKHKLSPEETRYCLEKICSCTTELDQLTRELSNYIYESKANSYLAA